MAFVLRVHRIINLQSDCEVYVKAKLGYQPKQKTEAKKKDRDENVSFDEDLVFDRWVQGEKLHLSLWKVKKTRRREISSATLEYPASRTGTYDRVCILTRDNKQGFEHIVGSVDVTVTHVPANRRYSMVQELRQSTATQSGPNDELNGTTVT